MSQKIKRFLSECKVEFVRDGLGEVAFITSNSAEGLESLSGVRDIFLAAGYADEAIEVRSYGGDLELVFKLGTSHWKRGLRIFETFSELWDFCQRDQSVPDTLFVSEDRELVEPGDEVELLKKFETYFHWVRLLKRLSEEGAGNELKYIVASDGALKRYTVSVFKDYKGIQSASVSLESAETAKALISQLDIVDAHEKQRHQVMLSTLSSILDDYSGRDPVCWVIEHEASFKRKFYENYEVYTQRFSVDKLLTEVFDKQNDYASKVLESVSSNQAKALALPGALIAVGALIRSADVFSLLLVCVGLYVVYIFTRSANTIGRESLLNLESQIDRAFRDFIRPDMENEVVSGAGEAKILIKSQISSAVQRLDMVDSWALYIFFFGCAFAVLSVFPLSQLLAAFELFISILMSWGTMLCEEVSLIFSLILEWASSLASCFQNLA